ncbi:hypothetical protein BZA77DRAFT_125356 [Pyronema omphalodes]|nr:hypothetical protein BZA77DRAFT_125356 [Pyronema omphalodes]
MGTGAMEISGLVYREHSSTTSSTSRTVIAPHLPMATMEQNNYVQDHIFSPYGGAGQYGFGSTNAPTNIPTNTQQYQVVGHSTPYGQPFGTGPAQTPPQQRLHHHTAEQHQEFQSMSHRIQQQGILRDQQNIVRPSPRQQGQKGVQMKTTGYGFQKQQQSPTLPTGSLHASNPTRPLGMPVVMSQEQQLRRQPTQQHTTPPQAHQLQHQHQIQPQQQHQQLQQQQQQQQQQQGQLQQHQHQQQHQLQLQHQLNQHQIHPIKQRQQQTQLPQQQIVPVQNVPSFRHQQEHEQNPQQQQQLQEQRIKQDQQQRVQQEHLRQQQQQQQQQQHLERRHSEQQIKQQNCHSQPQRHPQFQNSQLQHQRSLQQISRSPPQLHAQTPPPVPENITTPPTQTAEISALAGTLATVGTSKVQSPNAEVDFKTDVDNLMKAIQAKVPRAPIIKGEKSVSPPPYTSPKPFQASPQVFARFQEVSPPLGLGEGERMLATGGPPLDTKEPEKKAPKQRKRYECTVPGCAKAFFQRTHLDIHSRAHTGDKPFHCSEAGCGQRFSQLGNLKTHERRHTGEKPYSCDICGKRFAQRGNVRAHKIVHQGAKPFICKLDNCLKQFTQLGNLKSHQNKFHTQALRELTEKFMSIRDPEDIAPSDRGLFEYFADLYKNSNRGIKGRGKDRKIRNVRDFSSDNGGNGYNTITSPGSVSTTSGGDNYGVYPGGAMDEDEEESGGYDGRQQHPQQMQQQQLPSISRNMIPYNY